MAETINIEENLKTLKKIKNTDVEEFSLKNKTFLAKVVDIYDGDTCKIVFYLDDKIVKFTCRLNGIDTPELKPLKTKANRDEEIEKAKQCKNKLIELCCGSNTMENNDKLVFIKCNEFDKYGRLLIDIYNSKECETSFNHILVKEGLAKCYDGGKKN
jgi:endonuclease YncB( thermonuclease family)